MRRTIFAMAALMLVLGPTAFAATGPQQLTLEMAARIAKAMPDMKVTVEAPLTLKLVGGSQGETQINLDRLADFCAANPPKECEDAKETFVRGSAEAALAPHEVTRENLRVIVRSADYAAAMQQIMAERGTVLVIRSIGDGLTAMLAADFPNTTSLVPAVDLKALSLGEAEAFELGRKNVLANLPRLPTATDLRKQVTMIAGHDYDASLLLADGWKELAEQTNGKLFVTVAEANLVVVGLAEDDDAARRLRPIAEEGFRSAERGVSPEVYRWSDRGWLAVK